MPAGRHRRRLSRASVIGRCCTTAAGVAALAAGISSVAPSHPDDPTFTANSARAAFDVPVDDLEVDVSWQAELRASRGLPVRPSVPPSTVAPTPAPPDAAPTPAPAVATPSPTPTPTPELTTSTARTGAAVERGLTANAMKALNAVRAAYPQLGSIGGVRSQPGSDHSTGQAIDVMVPGYATASGRALGDALAAFVQSHAGELSVDYVIWRQRIWSPGRGGWRAMSDRGDATANHLDHVHISVR